MGRARAVTYIMIMTLMTTLIECDVCLTVLTAKVTHRLYDYLTYIAVMLRIFKFFQITARVQLIKIQFLIVNFNEILHYRPGVSTPYKSYHYLRG